MGYGYKWKPSKTAAREFAAKMDNIAEYCAAHGITQSRAGDSYYFYINGVNYRVSNHTPEASDRAAFNFYGEQVREKYHNGRKPDTVYITASKTRIIEIYEDLQAGRTLDGRGFRISEG